jgi:hypothetical protein
MTHRSADTFSPFLTDVEVARRQLLLQRADLNGTSLALRLDLLLVEAAAGLLRCAARGERPGLGNDVAGYDDAGLVFLDLKAESDWLLGTYLHEALTLSLAGIIAIVVLLSISLRSPAGPSRHCAADRRDDSHRRGSADCRGPVVDLQSVRIAAGRRVGSNYCLFFEGHFPDTDNLARSRHDCLAVLADLCTVIGFNPVVLGRPVLRGSALPWRSARPQPAVRRNPELRSRSARLTAPRGLMVAVTTIPPRQSTTWF